MGVSGAGVRARRFSAARRAHSASWPGSIRVLRGEEGIGPNGTADDSGISGSAVIGRLAVFARSMRLAGERIDQLDAGALDVSDVAGDQRQTQNPCRRD